MKKHLILPLAVATLGLATSGLWATDSNTPPPPPPPGEGGFHKHKPPISKEEMETLKAVKDKVLAANADLKAEEETLQKEKDALKAKGRDKSTKEEHEALMDKWQAHEKKVREAAVKLDPSVESIYKKLDEAKKKWGGPGKDHGAPPPPPAN